MKALLDFVKEKPTNEKSSDSPTCPLCSASDVRTFGTCTTLVGGGDEVNHTWTRCRCSKCMEEFTRETKSGNVWYTKDKKILKGIPSCFESYIYTCKECGGEVTREYRCLNSDSKPVVLCIDDNGPQYRTFYACAGCKKSVQTPSDYWYPGCEDIPKKRKKSKKAKKLKLGWKIYEEIGEARFNPATLAKIKINDNEKK